MTALVRLPFLGSTSNFMEVPNLFPNGFNSAVNAQTAVKIIQGESVSVRLEEKHGLCRAMSFNNFQKHVDRTSQIQVSSNHSCCFMLFPGFGHDTQGQCRKTCKARTWEKPPDGSLHVVLPKSEQKGVPKNL